ncbi:succinate dehydrogenase cytochrome b subunit [Zhouia sp. PK063]|uniref:succinate dehydrogenase cytochrome b subunit n=1 Tax=Zhouia sp. PK063 TaxID=3373602 RepID=UPI0037981AA2
MSGFIKSSVARKIAMALSAFFLIIFLLQHFIINFTSVISPEKFNELSHFMGTNGLVQFLLQPVLIFGIVFHFIMGFILEARNRGARAVKYVKYSGNANSSWMSRNMLISGIVILLFLGLHFYDFWFPEIAHKYIEGAPADATRYYGELVAKFQDPIRVGLYCLAFVFLALHLYHGFSSAFQSVGARNKYSPGVRKFGIAFSIIIPLGFIFIALFHHFNSL